MSNPSLAGSTRFCTARARMPAARRGAAALGRRKGGGRARRQRAVLRRSRAPALVAAARALAEVFRGGGRLFTMGNGGSSCDAAHIAVEFLHPVTAGRPALPAINLAADVAMLSAIGNDLGFEHVFVRQLIAQARAGRRGDRRFDQRQLAEPAGRLRQGARRSAGDDRPLPAATAGQ